MQRHTYQALAERVIELYWPQVRDYLSLHGDGAMLRQSSQPRAITVDAIRDLRLRAEYAGVRNLYTTKERLPVQYEQTLNKVELNLVQMPLGKLQRPAGFRTSGTTDYPRFIYDDADFHEGITNRQLRKRPLYVVLKPGAAGWLVSLGGLLRPLLELHWTREVARLNRQRLNEDDLRQFLFGAAREDLSLVRRQLYEVQAGRCFYCEESVPYNGGEVDHFVPWSRVPNDALANLVLADSRCNNNKSDHYADLALLARWATRPSELFQDIATRTGWPFGRGQSMRITRGLYAHLPEGTHLWQAPGVYTVLHRSEVLKLLPRLNDFEHHA